MYGVVERGSGPLPDGGFAKYRVRWDGRIDDWYAKKQCLEYVIRDGPICREDLVPAVVVPASSAHFEGGNYCCTPWRARAARSGTVWRGVLFSSTRRRGGVLLSTRRDGVLCAPATPSTR